GNAEPSPREPPLDVGPQRDRRVPDLLPALVYLGSDAPLEGVRAVVALPALEILAVSLPVLVTPPRLPSRSSIVPLDAHPALVSALTVSKSRGESAERQAAEKSTRGRGVRAGRCPCIPWLGDGPSASNIVSAPRPFQAALPAGRASSYTRGMETKGASALV